MSPINFTWWFYDLICLTVINTSNYHRKTYNETGLSIEGYLWAISQAALDTLEYMDLSAPDDVIAVGTISLKN